MEVYADECTDNQVSKSFTLTDGAVTRDMLAITQEKLHKNIKSLLNK